MPLLQGVNCAALLGLAFQTVQAMKAALCAAWWYIDLIRPIHCHALQHPYGESDEVKVLDNESVGRAGYIGVIGASLLQSLQAYCRD